jgi:hypothetical protein
MLWSSSVDRSATASAPSCPQVASPASAVNGAANNDGGASSCCAGGEQVTAPLDRVGQRLLPAGHVGEGTGAIQAVIQPGQHLRFISPRTIERHLGNVFTRLGITSRKDLR